MANPGYTGNMFYEQGVASPATPGEQFNDDEEMDTKRAYAEHDSGVSENITHSGSAARVDDHDVRHCLPISNVQTSVGLPDKMQEVERCSTM